MADVFEIDAATGEAVERDFTKSELAQRAADESAYRKHEAEERKGVEARNAVRASTVAKLVALGLTVDEVSLVMDGTALGTRKAT